MSDITDSTVIATDRGPVNLDTPADQRLYELSAPIEYGWEDQDRPTTRFVVASACVAPFSGPETYLFPSDENGEIIDRGELCGSYKGGLSHEAAIFAAGWILERQ